MTGLVTGLARGVLVGMVVAGLSPFAGPAPAVAAERDVPLEVSVDSLTPSTVPRGGAVTVTGQITNTSEETWTDLNVYLLTSRSPFRTREELAEANATDPTTEVGPRLTDAGLFDAIGDLSPGSSTSYSLSVPRRALQISGEPGVYWLGVHVLGGNEDGRDGVADGRARSFIPLMAPRGPSTSLSVVIPVKGEVRREPDGSLTRPEMWHELLSPDGRLGRLLDFSGTSGPLPVTWVVDPAVLDAAGTAADDNPPIDTGPTSPEDAESSAETQESPSASPPDGDAEDAPDDGQAADEEGEAERSPGAVLAASWLETFQRQASQHAVMSVPYADADVAAMLRSDAERLYRRAVDLSAATLDELAVDSSPLVAPPDGFLPAEALTELDSRSPVLLSDAAAPRADGTVIETGRGQQLVLSDAAAGSGGPAPTDPFSALAMRQRVISEAALHALSEDRAEPLVVATPQEWDPGSDWRIASFFTGLDVPWLRSVTLPDVIAGADDEGAGGAPPPPGAEEPQAADLLRYPRFRARAEIPVANLLASRQLTRTGEVFAELLTRNETVDQFLAKSAMLASSYEARDRPKEAAERVRNMNERVRSQLTKVFIDGPSFVTMSSETGPIIVTVVNGLEEPVTVGIAADTGSPDLDIRPPEPVPLGAGQRATVRLRASSQNIGVYPIRLMPTTATGRPLGNATTFSVRSSQVGIVIWVIMGVGGAALFIASGIRITRRVRARRATHGPLLGRAQE